MYCKRKGGKEECGVQGRMEREDAWRREMGREIEDGRGAAGMGIGIERRDEEKRWGRSLERKGG